MNPFPPYQFTQPRDKTKSYFQPSINNHNPFSTSQVHSQASTISHHSSTSTYQSDKYKSYYTQFQDYRPATQQNNYYVTSTAQNIPLQRQKSYQRSRFYTVTEQQRRDYSNVDNHPLGNLQEDNFSQSMIVMTNRPTSINAKDDSNNSKKDGYKFAANKFSSSRVESQYNSREKKESHSQNKSEYLEKANKKVSLKRDIAPISPKYQGDTSNLSSNNNNTPKYPPHQPSFVNISNRFNINQNNNTSTNHPSHHQNTPSTQHHQKSMPFLPSANQPSSTVFPQNLSQLHTREALDNSQKATTIQDMIIPSTLERYSQSSQTSDNLSINRRNSDKEGSSKQLSFKKNSHKERVSTYQAQRAISSYDLERTTPSSHASSVTGNNNNNHHTSHIGSNTNEEDRSINQNIPKTATNSKPFFGSIRSNNSKQKPTPLIDSQLLTDMKISRIQQSTSNLSQQLVTLTKSLQQLMHQSKQQQLLINQINLHISKQQEQGVTPQDIKRMKKQLKIMKTNFQTAFTSMTEQINRKLSKQETIMKNLSDQISYVAEENIKLNQTIERRSRKVDSLQKSMTSFMRQNQQRMQNLVLNESFSSSKRSKNHSFEYGLDLKNMSSDDNYSSGKSYFNNGVDSNLAKRLQSIQKEISKMKVFHIKEQETYMGKFLEFKKDIDKVMVEQQKYLVRTDAQRMVREAVQQILQVKLENIQILKNQHQTQLQTRFNSQLLTIKHKIDQLNKTCHEELYDYRLNKLQQQQQTTPKFVTQSKIKTMNSQLEQQLVQLQGKQRSMLVMLTDFQQKLILSEDRQMILGKNYDDLKIKELKHTGDVRQIQLSLKQVNHIMHSLNSFKQTALVSLNELSQVTGLQKGLLNSLQARTSNLQTRLTQTDRINTIQTENIESINNEFERVINKEIIPKIKQVHHVNGEVSQKIHALGMELAAVKRLYEGHGGHNHGENTSMNIINPKKPQQQLDESFLQKKLQQYLSDNMHKHITSKVKLISTKLLSSKSPLSKIGLFKDKRPPSSINTQYETQPEIGKQETYLIDDEGYLMDWEGAYLMEVDEYGNRKRIRVTQEELYFMEVNGLEIKKTVVN